MLKQCFIHSLLLTIERTLSVSTILKSDKYHKNKIANAEILLSEPWNVLALKAGQMNGLTKNDKNMLTSLIIDWADRKIKEKERNTVYWYSRQG